MIIFGTGGGFAGTVTEYCILENGQCFLKKASESEFQAIDDLESKVTEQAFKNFTTLGLNDIKLKAPGNMYFFIKYGPKENMQELIWGAYGQDPPPKLKSYYDYLNNLTNKQVTK
jgi:hypothetical protein